MSGHRHRRDSQGHHSSCSGRLSRGACCGDHCWQRSSTGRHAELQRTHGNHSMTASFIQPSLLPWQGDSTREATTVVSGAWACTGTVVVATGTTAAAAGASPWWPSCGDPCWQRGSTGRHAQLKHRHSRHAIDLITASSAGTLAQDEPIKYIVCGPRKKVSTDLPSCSRECGDAGGSQLSYGIAVIWSAFDAQVAYEMPKSTQSKKEAYHWQGRGCWDDSAWQRHCGACRNCHRHWRNSRCFQRGSKCWQLGDDWWEEWRLWREHL